MKVKKVVTKFGRNIKDVFIVAKQSVKHETKGCSNEVCKKLGVKKTKYKKKTRKQLHKEYNSKATLNLGGLYG